jgi:UDP-glucose 4-epimerase
MKALVTGGAGFIGSNLVDELIKKGYSVVSLDDQSAESNENFFWNEKSSKEVVDITNYDDVLRLFELERPNVVFHLAAESRIQPTLERPQRACEVNFVGTCNVLQASRVTGVERVVYSSTSSAYGLRNDPPLKEDMPRDCLNPYSVTKVAAEDLCKMYYTLWGLKTVIFRYFNVYGERQPVKGQYAPVVGIFQRQVENGELMTIVGSGLQRRDFTHVSDVVQANILAAKSDNKEAFGQIFNVGTGKNHSVLELAKLIGDKLIHMPERPGEAATTLADISKIKKYLGYEPTIELEDWINEQKR